MGRLGKVLAVCAVAAFSAQAVQADFVSTVETTTGGSGLKVTEGDTFTLNLNLASDQAPQSDRFQSFAIEVDFGGPGLTLNSYDFPSGVLTVGGADDGSTAPGAIGRVIEFTNLSDTTGDEVHEGTLVSMNLTANAPGDYAIFTIPDFFEFDLFEAVDTFAGPGFELSVNPIPEPMTLALLGVGGLVALRRRRRTA